jgi:hypothetical protein
MLNAQIMDSNGYLQWFIPEVDNGCTITCIHPKIVQKFGLKTSKLPFSIPVVNADGTDNKQGESCFVAKVHMVVNNHKELIEALVLDIGANQMLLGLDWLSVHNPEIDWSKGIIQFNQCPKDCHRARMKSYQLQKLVDLKIDDQLNLDANQLPKGKIPDYVKNKFGHLFEPQNFDKLPKRREWDHAIELEDKGDRPEDKKPKSLPAMIYRMTLDERKALEEFIEAELKAGKIRVSKSPYASPCFFIKKKDGSLRLVQDYRKLNYWTKKDKFPLPRIDDLIDVLHDGKYFTKMDILWGYNNVRIREGDEELAAFLTPLGLYEPTVMYFGLCNSPATFSRMMAVLFREMIRQRKCVIYMDDIVFIGKTLQELKANTLEGLAILDKAELYIKEPKCYWEVEEVPILGHIVGKGITRMEPAKTQVIKDWKAPTNKKEVQKFIGFCNFYRRYVRNFSKIARPITKLTGDVAFVWTQEEQKAFEQLKEAILSPDVISLPQPDGLFRMEVDASGYAIGGVLSQLQDGKWKTIAFISRVLSPAEINYDIFDKELLAVMYAVEEWRCYLLSAKQPFEIWTDHNNLKYFKQPQKLNSRQMRWYLTLQDYDFVLKHVPGTSNTKADMLSRLPWYKEEIPTQENLVLLPKQKFIEVKQCNIKKPCCTLQNIALFVEEQFCKGGTKLKKAQEIKSVKNKQIKRAKAVMIGLGLTLK